MPRVTRPAAASALLLVIVVGFGWIGRAAVTSDGAEVLAEATGLLVTGRLEAAYLPGERSEHARPDRFHSVYGAFPSLLALPFLAPAWAARDLIGPRGVEAAVSLLWATGAVLASLGFLAVARALAPRPPSPFWAPAFLAGTFLWPYAADSFFEGWAGGLLAFAGARILSPGLPTARRDVVAGALFVAACLLKPVCWVTAPAFLLGWALARRGRPGASVPAGPSPLVLPGTIAAGLLLALGANILRFGAVSETGYGGQLFAFSTPFATGFAGLFLLPGRSLFLFAPIVVVAALSWRHLTPAARCATYLAPALLALVVARWWSWHGAGAWGPRLLLPALPLLAAPALASAAPSARKLAAGALALGALLNLPGVLVSPGAFMGYAESLRGEATSAWPVPGTDRVSVVPALSMLYGHWWLLSSVGTAPPRPRLPHPWPGTGPVPPSALFISPAWLRAALGLPPAPPVLPTILVRTAIAFDQAGRPREARLFADEAERLARGGLSSRR